MRKAVRYSTETKETRKLLAELKIHTVCHEAVCPNQLECFSRRTATFMILGNICTRSCAFCAVKKGRPEPLDNDEPIHVARGAARLGLKYVVVTSVTRDDLIDSGARQFASTIKVLHLTLPTARVEVLTPDFGGSPEAIALVAAAGPDVFSHNVETVPRLYSTTRPLAEYKRSLEILRMIKTFNPAISIKSGIIVGLGERPSEVLTTMEELRATGCDFLTVGQYLQPTPWHHSVVEFVLPEIYDMYKEKGHAMGFKKVWAGPWVRSSYRASEILDLL